MVMARGYGGFVGILWPLLAIRINQYTDETDPQSLWAVCDYANVKWILLCWIEVLSIEVELSTLALPARFSSVTVKAPQDFNRDCLGDSIYFTLFTYRTGFKKSGLTFLIAWVFSIYTSAVLRTQMSIVLCPAHPSCYASLLILELL